MSCLQKIGPKQETYARQNHKKENHWNYSLYHSVSWNVLQDPPNTKASVTLEHTTLLRSPGCRGDFRWKFPCEKRGTQLRISVHGPLRPPSLSTLWLGIPTSPHPQKAPKAWRGFSRWNFSASQQVVWDTPKNREANQCKNSCKSLDKNLRTKIRAKIRATNPCKKTVQKLRAKFHCKQSVQKIRAKQVRATGFLSNPANWEAQHSIRKFVCVVLLQVGFPKHCRDIQSQHNKTKNWEDTDVLLIAKCLQTSAKNSAKNSENVTA